MKKRSVLFLWVAEFALLLLLTILFSWRMSVMAEHKLLQEYAELTETQQSRVELAMNNCIAQLQAQGVSLVTDLTIRNFAGITSPTRADNYALWVIRNRLISDNSAARYVKETQLYFHNVDKALSDTTIVDAEGLARRLYGNADVASMKALRALLAEPVMDRIAVIGSDSGVTAVMLSSIPSSGRSVQAMAVQVLDMDEIALMTSTASVVADATTALVTEEGALLCWSGDGALVPPILQAFAAGVEGETVPLGDERYYYQQQSFSSVGLALVTVIPMETIARRGGWVRQMILVVLPLYLVLGVLVAAASIGFNYLPLHRLKKHLPPELETGTGNEYEQLDHAFQTVQRDLEDVRLMQQRQRQEMLRGWLYSILLHDLPVSSAAAAQILNSVGLHPAESWFALYLLAEDEAELLPEFSEQVVLAHFQERHVLCLLAKDETGLSALIAECGLPLREDQIFSPPICGPAGLHAAYVALCERQEAEEAARQGNAASGGHFTAGRRDEILQFVFSGEGESACAALAEAMARVPSLPVAQLQCAGLLRDIYVSVPPGPAAAEVRQAVDSSWRAEHYTVTRGELLELMQTLLTAVAGKYRPDPAAGADGDELLARITRCTAEHFREHDFNVSRMADLLGVNVTYLSKYFKSRTGLNLLAYLNGLRIDYAKKLIDEGGITIAAAADQAGFENVNTFIRLFKKYVGDTPGSYSRH